MKEGLFIAGNWKDQKGNREDVEAWFREFTALASGKPDVFSRLTVVVAAPHTFLYGLNKLIDESVPVHVGAQDLSQWSGGDVKKTYTGENTGSMIRSVGAEYVIIGHSERRDKEKNAETDTIVAQKIAQAFQAGLVPIVCVGETKDEKEEGKTKDVLTRQLTSALGGLTEDHLRTLVVAYEPVWAIGTGVTATPQDVEETVAFIKETAKVTTVIYGGSVNDQNVDQFVGLPHVDGVLPGGASLKPATFFGLIAKASSVLS